MSRGGFVDDFLAALDEGEYLSRKQMKEVLDALWELDSKYFEAAGYYPLSEDFDDEDDAAEDNFYERDTDY